MSLLKRLGRFFLRPNPLVWGANLLRAIKPLFSLRGTEFVFRHDDVSDLLLRQADFGVKRLYAANMEATTGAFFLGMDDGPRYEAEHAFAASGLRDGDMDRVARSAEVAAKAILEEHAASGKIDLVGEYFRRVPVVLLGEFFGVPAAGKTVDADLARWMRAIFWELFLNPGRDEAVTKRALDCSGELRAHLELHVAKQRVAIADGDGASDTFLGRLVAGTTDAFKGMDDDAIYRNVGGVIVGSVDTVSKSCSLALEELMLRPDMLAGARRAALDCDDAALNGYVFEALRFNPHTPILIRHATRDAKLAPGTDRERPVKEGDKIIPVLIAATFDPQTVEDPKRFDPTRKLSASMNFGWGLHRCFGERLVHAVVPVLMRNLLALEDLQADRSAYAPYESEGPFPDHYPASFRPKG